MTAIPPRSRDLEDALPPKLVAASIFRSGDEFVFPYEQTLTAITVAGEHAIAVLGIELLKVDADKLQTISYSAYDLKASSDWSDFVKSNNAEAISFIKANRFGDGYGYILTSVSQQEFKTLQVK